MNTVDRVINIVSYMAERTKPLSIADISKQLHLSKSGVYRIISFLEGAGWVTQQSDTGWYSLGPQIVAFSVNILSKLDIRSASHPYLEELRDVINETAILSIRIGHERVVVDQLTPSHNLLYFVHLGKRTPLWIGSHGKAILAFLSECEIEMVMEDVRKSNQRTYDSGERIDIGKIRQQLTTFKREGFAVSSGESVAGVVGVGAPIFGRDHEVIGSLAVAAPLTRLSEVAARQHGPLLQHLAKEISLRLGDFG